MFSQFFSVENVFESTLLIALVSACVGLFVAYLIWGIKSAIVHESESATKWLRQQTEVLSAKRERLRKQQN